MRRLEQAEADLAETVRLWVYDKLDVPTIAKRLGVGRPCVLKRLERAGLYTPTRQNQRRRKVHVVSDCDADPDALAAPRINREPCTFCGVRADIGCKHSRQNWWTVLAPPSNSGDTRFQPMASANGGGAAGLAPFSRPAALNGDHGA